MLSPFSIFTPSKVFNLYHFNEQLTLYNYYKLINNKPQNCKFFLSPKVLINSLEIAHIRAIAKFIVKKLMGKYSYYLCKVWVYVLGTKGPLNR